MNRILAIIALLFALSCMRDSYTSMEKYSRGDILECIVSGGAKIRETPSTKKSYIGKIPLGKKMVFLEIASDKKSTYVFNGRSVTDYWLKVNVDDNICYIHGGAVTLRERFVEEASPSERVDYSSRSTSGDLYIAIMDVKLRQNYRLGSKVLRQVEKGELVFSSIEMEGDSYRGCNGSNKHWIKIENGWSWSGGYIKLSKQIKPEVDDDIFREEYLAVYLSTRDVPIRIDTRDNSTRVGTLPGYQFFGTKNEVQGREVSYCSNISDTWVEHLEGWVSDVSLVKIEDLDLLKRSVSY